MKVFVIMMLLIVMSISTEPSHKFFYATRFNGNNKNHYITNFNDNNHDNDVTNCNDYISTFSHCIFLAGIPDEQPASPSRPPSTPAVAVLVGVAGLTTVGVTRLDRWAGPALPRNR